MWLQVNYWECHNEKNGKSQLKSDLKGDASGEESSEFQFLSVSACQYMHVHDMSVKPEEEMWKTQQRERKR